MIQALEELEIDKIIMDHAAPSTESPDAVFPNNWFSTHPEGLLFTYPMRAINRRTEVNVEFIRSLGNYKHIPLEQFAQKNMFLEGTGSMILDHEAKYIYASRSERTNEELLQIVAEQLGSEIILFDAFSPSGRSIYHTNVIMHVGKMYVCAGTALIPNLDRRRFREHVKSSGKELIELTNDQVMQHFAGNMIQVVNRKNERILLLSKTAFQSLSPEQLERLSAHNDQILPLSIPTIEAIGGGSVRCMIAEIW